MYTIGILRLFLAKHVIKKTKQKKEQKKTTPITFEQTLAEPALIHNFSKIKTPPHTHTRTHR